MSNGKSTIYPVPLQDSLLNINKFESDIKPFSGFNKNNSPFVGGVLNNLWERHEPIKPDYIANNGDEFRIDSSGLYKAAKLTAGVEQHFESIYDYPGTAKFLHKEEIKLQFSSIYEETHCKKVYLVKDASHFIYLAGGDNDNILFYNDGTQRGVLINLNNYTNYDSIVVFSEKAFKLYTSVPNTDGLYSSLACFKFGSYNITIPYSYCYKPDNIPPAIFEHVNGTVIATNSQFCTCDSSGNPSISGLHFIQQFKDGESAYYLDEYEVCFSASSPAVKTKLRDYFLTDEGYSVATEDYNDGFVACSGYLLRSFSIGSQSQRNIISFRFLNLGSTEWGPIPGSYSTDVICMLNNALILEDFTAGMTSFTGWEIFIKKIARYCVDAVIKATFNIGADEKTVAFGVSSCNPVLLRAEDDGTLRNVGGLETNGILYNNGELSNISDGDVLLEDWNVIDESTLLKNPTGENLYTYQVNGKWYRIYYGSPELYIKGNIVVSNVNSLDNAYNFMKDEKVQFGRNDNCRYCSPDGLIYAMEVDEETALDFFIDSAYNEYALDKNATLLLNPELATKWTTDSVQDFLKKRFKNFMKNTKTQKYVNIYCGETSNNECIYSFSIQINPDETSNQFLTDSKLVDLPFPSDTNGNVSYNPNLFSQVIDGFNNLKFVKNGTTAYPLQIINDEAVMSYYLASSVEDLDEVFILQGQAYGVKNGQIFSFSFSNGVVSNSQSVVNVKGLQYIAATSEQAFFWSKANMTLYSFNGANVLNRFLQSDKITDIYYSAYNSTTGDILLCTNEGLFVISNNGNFVLSDVKHVKNIFITEESFFIDSSDFDYIKQIAYRKFTGYLLYFFSKRNIELETGFYGVDETHMSINDTLYLRLFSPERESGEIEFSATTIANEIKKTGITKIKITSDMWDTETNTCVVRYQPKTQRALGTSFRIVSPFAIASMSVSNITDNAIVDNASKDSKITQIAPATKGEW